MKILTKSKRNTVRFLVKRAVADLNTAIGIILKAYGSSELHYNLRRAVKDCEDSIAALQKTRLPENNSSARPEIPVSSPFERPHRAGAGERGNPPPETRETEKETQAEERPAEETNTEKRFREIVCEKFGIGPEACRPEATFTEDLGADELDCIELAMSLEAKFVICITDNELEHATTYGKLLNLVKEKVAANYTSAQPKEPF